MSLHLTPRVLALLSTAGFALGQDFSYPDFSSVAGLVMNQDAAQAGNALRVTANANNQKGSAFYDQPVRVAGGFTCTFTFSVTVLGGGGADGMTFIIHNAAAGLAALGDTGSGMGYARNASLSIENALAIEIDTWNSGLGDPNENHVSIHTGGTGPNDYDEAQSLGNAIPSVDMSDGAMHTMVVAYDGATLSVFVDDLVSPLVSAPYSFATGGTYIGGGAAGGLNLINGDSAYVGFTAGTGGANENHDVHSWEWQDASGPIGTNYCGPANLNSSGQPALISAVGSLNVAANNLSLEATQVPAGETGMFLVGFNAGFLIPPGGQGNLCIYHPIGRYLGSLQGTGAGSFKYSPDLTSTPIGSGTVAVQPGETWLYQAWFSDGSSYNFTDAVMITYQ